MVSTLKLTKIQIPNSDSDVISLDASTGNVTLNKTLGGTSITVQGENTATTNLQQGLAKQWCQFEGDATVSITNSFNVGSLTDTATGDYNLSYSNNMSDTGYSMTGGGIHDAGSYIWHVTVDHDTTAFTTSSCQMNVMDHNNGQRDAELITHTIHGDLA